MNSDQKVLSKALSRFYNPKEAREYFFKNYPTLLPSTKIKAYANGKEVVHGEFNEQMTSVQVAIESTINGDNPKVFTESDRAQLKHLAQEQHKEIDELNQKRKRELETISTELYHENLRLDSERYTALEAIPKLPRGLDVIETHRQQAERDAAIAAIKNDTQTAKNILVHAADEAKAASLRRNNIEKTTVIQKFAAETASIKEMATTKLVSELQHAFAEADADYEKVKQDLARLLGRPT